MDILMTKAFNVVFGASSFSLNNIINAVSQDGKNLTSGIGAIMGVVLALFGMIMIGIGVAKKQGKSSFFVTGFLALIVGAFFGVNAFNKAKDLGTGVAGQVDKWGQGQTDIDESVGQQ